MVLIGCIFGMAKHEIDSISDLNQTFMLFSSMVSFTAMIVAIVAVIATL